MSTTKDDNDKSPSEETPESNENHDDNNPPNIKTKKTPKPKYKALHAYRYRTKIPQTEVQFFEESLDQYRIKTETNTNDRAKNKLFKIPWLGKLQISEPTGAITIYTHDPQSLYILERKIGKPLFRALQTNLIVNSLGTHIPTTQIKLGQTIKTDQNTPLGKATITTTLGIHRGYIDLHQHFKIPSPYSDKFIEKKASKCRVSDAVILTFAIFNGQVTPNDYACFGLRSKSLYPRLVRMEKKGLLCRLGGKGIIYIVTGVANSIINRSSQSVR